MNEQKDTLGNTLNVEKIREDANGFKAMYKSQFLFVHEEDLVNHAVDDISKSIEHFLKEAQKEVLQELRIIKTGLKELIFN